MNPVNVVGKIKAQLRFAAAGAVDALTQGSPFGDDKPLTDADLKAAYRRLPSISDKLPWLDLVGENYNTVLLDDAVSVGAAWRVTPAAVEGRSDDYIAQVRDAVQRALNHALPTPAANPWVVTCYARREAATFAAHSEPVRRYAQEKTAGREHPFTDHYLDTVLAPHLQDTAAPRGLFTDNLSDLRWGGADWEIILTLHRRIPRGVKQRRSPEQALELAGKQFAQALRQANVVLRRLDGYALRAWLARWLNPRPKQTGGDVNAFIEALPDFATADRPVDWSLADDVASRDVRSDGADWYFDGMPHTLLHVGRLRAAPAIGQTTAERRQGAGGAPRKGDRIECMFDKLPPGATLIITVTPLDQTRITGLLDRREQQARGEAAEAVKTQETVAHARRAVIDGNYVYPVAIAVALRANTDAALREQVDALDTLLTANHCELVDPEHDLFRLDSYLRHLPFAYDPRLKQLNNRQDWMYTQHLANLLPLYGRATGTGRPGLTFFNRGGELFAADPLHFGDRTKNAHLFLFGPTGAGKSATLVYLMLHYMAIHRPRLIIVEAGNSFGLLLDYFRAQGLATHDIVLKPGCGASLPPFAGAMELLDEHGAIPTGRAAGDAQADSSGEPLDASTRDYLGEMVKKAELMITGGDPAERFDRQDQALVKEAILKTAQRQFHAGKTVTVSDVIGTLTTLAGEAVDREQQRRLNAMATALRLFEHGFEGELFNRPAATDNWPADADVIRVEMGTLAGGDYPAQLALAYIGLINHAVAMAEASQRSGRPIILLTDEGHAISTNPITAQYKVLISKLTGRRMALWLWDATQNMADYPDEAEKMLGMFEWWLVMNLDANELAEVERFKPLSPDQRAVILGCTKQPGDYAEGVVLADTLEGQYRNVPPALALALAQTEQHEKTARAGLMRAHDCTELEAAIMIAEQIRAKRRGDNG